MGGFEKSGRQPERRALQAQLNMARIKASGGEGGAEFQKAAADVDELNRNLKLARDNAAAFAVKARAADDALHGGPPQIERI